MKENLELLFRELSLRTPIAEVKPECYDVLYAFLSAESEYRRQYKIARLLRISGIRQVKTFSHFDWHFNPKIPRDDILTFLSSTWVKNAANLLLIGDAGLGKSHIAKAFCYEAIIQGFSTTFITAFDLISKIKKALSASSKIDYFAKVTVLCIDELGYTFHSKEDTDCIFQIISKRCELLPTIVTTNLPPKDWGSIFSGAAASAILDRLSSNGRFITFEGSSYRLLRKQKTK